MNHAQFWGGGGAAPYEIEQSLRFDGSSRLTRTHSCSQTRTFSFWNKYAFDNSNRYLYFHGDGSNYIGTRSGGSPNFNSWQTLNQGSSFTQIYRSDVKFRDPAAWYHFVFKCTSSNVILYINGEEWGSSGGANVALSSKLFEIGSRGNAEFFTGYQAEWHFADGQALDPTDFGEYDDNGVWRPIRYTGTYGTNGFYLKFDPSATNGIGHDHSGNGNNFTATGFTTSGTGTDVMSDTPTTNYCTWNPLTIRNGSGTMSLTEGNLKFGSTASTTYGSILATIAPTSGKYYCELTFEGTKSSNYNRELFGIVPIANWQTNTRVDVHQIPGSLVYESNGTSSLAHQGTGGVANTQSYGVAWDENSNIGIAIDFDTPSLTFYVDGSSQGTFPYSMTAGEAYAIFAVDWSNFVEISAFILNAGQRAFSYTPPSGYSALNTANLPAPDIADGSQYFNTVTYTGDGTSSHAITGVGFQPDWVWLKSRSLSQAGNLIDAVRGVDKYLRSSSTAAEATFDFLSSFDTDGFTLGTSDAGANQSSATYVAWNWLGANGTSSNTDGSITSTVSANPTAGFSIVSYTGDGTQFATIGHGLGVAPKMVIVKNRDSTNGWAILHTEVGTTGTTLDGAPEYYMMTFTTNGRQNFGSDSVWDPTSTTFKVAATTNANWVNGNGSNYIAYCFAEVEGYSKFGSYTGNGSTDGPFVATSFTPAFLIWKRTDTSANWFMVDAVRNTYNPVDKEFYPDQPNAENTFTDVDFLSNGFKLRASAADRNANGGTFIYMCFASNPFGGSGVSPATAR